MAREANIISSAADVLELKGRLVARYLTARVGRKARAMPGSLLRALAGCGRIDLLPLLLMALAITVLSLPQRSLAATIEWLTATEVSRFLQPGDVLLIEFDCSVCDLIRRGGNSSFVHSAVVLETPDGDMVVAETGASLAHKRLGEFLKKYHGRRFKVRRPKQFLAGSVPTTELWEMYVAKYKGAPFNLSFRWDSGARGVQGAFLPSSSSYYCSQFVALLLNEVLLSRIEPVKMDFPEQDRERWLRYVPHLPQGELGLSPGDLDRSLILKDIADFVPQLRANEKKTKSFYPPSCQRLVSVGGAPASSG